jgi:hypothetical protein
MRTLPRQRRRLLMLINSVLDLSRLATGSRRSCPRISLRDLPPLSEASNSGQEGPELKLDWIHSADIVVTRRASIPDHRLLVTPSNSQPGRRRLASGGRLRLIIRVSDTGIGIQFRKKSSFKISSN